MPTQAPRLTVVPTDESELLSHLSSTRPADMPADRADFVKTTENHVTMWIDTGREFAAPGINGHAFRAIDLRGNLLWVMRTPLVRISHVSNKAALADAIEETRFAVERRAEIAQNFPHVRKVVDAVRAGRLDFPCTLEDGVQGGLSGASIEAYARRMSLPFGEHVPAWRIAEQIEKEPLAEFVIYAAWRRAGSPFPSG